MHISQLFNPLLLGVDIEIVVSSQPERPLSPPHGHRKLERLDSTIQLSYFWLIHQQMHVLRHDNIAEHDKLVSFSYPFKC